MENIFCKKKQNFVVVHVSNLHLAAASSSFLLAVFLIFLFCAPCNYCCQHDTDDVNTEIQRPPNYNKLRGENEVWQTPHSPNRSREMGSGDGSVIIFHRSSIIPYLQPTHPLPPPFAFARAQYKDRYKFKLKWVH